MNFKDVFDAHPDAEELFVVNEMPFLNKIDALNFASGDESKILTYPREVAAVKAEFKAKADVEAKAKAEAEAKARTEADAKAEADAKTKIG